MLKNSKQIFPKSLQTDDIDLCFSISASSHFLFLCNPDSKTSDLKSYFLSFLAQSISNDPLLIKNKIKSYSLERLDVIDLQDPMKFLSLVSHERKKMIIELVFFLEKNFSNYPLKIVDALIEIVSQILTSNPFELITNKIRESLIMIENLISELLKDLENINNKGFFNNNNDNSQNMTSPLSIMTNPASPKDPITDDQSLLTENDKKLTKKHLSSSIKSLKTLKFLLLKLGHLIHWKSFLKIKNKKHKTLAKFKTQPKSYDFFNNRSLFYIKELFKAQKLSTFVSQNPESIQPTALLKYFSWKLSHWKQEKPFSDSNLQNKNLVTQEMICKICLKPIEIQKMTLHSEHCMKRSELLRQLESLKAYFQRYFLKSTRNARYNEKLYGIERKKKKVVGLSNGLERKNSMKCRSVKNLRKSLKLKVFNDEKDLSPDGISDKIAGFGQDSPFYTKNQAQSQEKLRKIYRMIKLFDLIAKTSSFFLHEDLNKSKFLKNKSILY